MRENHESLKRTVLELLRHPDATPEHIMQVRETYTKAYESMVRAQNALLEKYGNYGGVARFSDWKGN
jgi:hypothetical protein